MRSNQIRVVARVALVIVAVLSLAGCDWMFIHSSAGNSGAAVDPGFGPDQLANLTLQWRFHPGYAIQSTPVTAGRFVYLSGGNGVLYALDTSNVVAGAPTVAWSRDYGMRTPSTCPTDPVGLVSTPAVRNDANGKPFLYVYSPQGTLQELDGTTGAVVWASRVYTVPADNQNDYFSWSSPSYSDATGLVYIGISSECDAPFVPSGVKAFDETTGALRASYSTMPNAPDPDYAAHDPKPPSTNYVGAGVWTTAPAVTSSGVYVTTGSTYDDTNSEHPATDGNAFDQYSVLKLNPSTLARNGKFAAPAPPDIGDPDWGSGALMFRAVINGTSVEMAGACNKDGNFYALRTDTMRPVWAVHVGLGTPAGEVACLSGGIWDGQSLYVTGNDTSVGGTWTKTTQTSSSGYSWPLYVPSGGTAAPSATRKLDPVTGLDVSGSSPKPYWEVANPRRVLGTCSLGGGGTLIACQTTDWDGTFNAVLLTGTDGHRYPALHDSAEWAGFGSPIWANGSLIVSDGDAIRSYAPKS
ncbi:MAG TPA: PQQ-binding-like beta-propeller repeat protein [Acidimicrobiia bacterium]|jgi:hypothetical protein